MQTNFKVECKAALGHISAPPIPMEAIRRAVARSADPVTPKRWTGTIVAALAGSALLGAAAGAAVWNSTHVSVERGGLINVVAQKASSLRNPTAGNLRALTDRADFPIVLPAGLPAGATLEAVNMFDSSAMMLTYDLPGAWRRSDHLLSIMLANPLSLDRISQKRSHRRY